MVTRSGRYVPKCNLIMREAKSCNCFQSSRNENSLYKILHRGLLLPVIFCMRKDPFLGLNCLLRVASSSSSLMQLVLVRYKLYKQKCYKISYINRNVTR